MGKRPNWDYVRLGSLAEFRNGINFTKENFGRGLKVINVKDFQDRSYPVFESLDEINPDGIIKNEDLLSENDIVFVRSNGNRQLIGRSLLIRNPRERVTHSAFTIRLRFTSPDVIPRFYSYLFRSDLIRQTLSAYGGGTNISNLNQRILNDLLVPLPPVREQQKATSILSAYDDLIENNLRRIKILEEMAQLIYREWFVSFRFPGHEKTKFVNSKLGKFPEDWRVRPLGECLDHQIGGGWGKEIESSKYSESAYVVRGTDIPSARVGEIDKCPLRFHTVSNLMNRRIRAGDLVFEVSGGSKDQPLGRVLLTTSHLLDRFDQAVICASFCKLMRTNDALPPGLLYLRLLEAYENRELMKYQVQSTGISNFKFTHFLDDFLMLVPSDTVREVFARLTDPLFELIAVLGARNANLRQTRDLLLPRLVSGEVDVEDLDIRIPEEEEVPIAQAV